VAAVRDAVAEDDGLDVGGIDLQRVQIMEDSSTTDSRVEQDRSRLLALLDPDERREPVLGHGPGTLEQIGSKGKASCHIGARH
jgi:hypothetical protein